MTGELRALALKVWDVSDKTLNPRYLRGSYLFINRLKLLDKVDGVYRLGERGNRFLAHDEGILRDFDAVEGIPKLLSLVAERLPCKRGDILPAWSDYLKAVSLFSTPKTFVEECAGIAADIEPATAHLAAGVVADVAVYDHGVALSVAAGRQHALWQLRAIVNLAIFRAWHPMGLEKLELLNALRGRNQSSLE